MFGRAAWVGASTPIGSMTLGRQNEPSADLVGPLVVSNQWAGGIGAHPGDTDNLYVNSRVSNSIKFLSQSYRGFRGGALFSFGGTPGAFNNNRIWSVVAGYTQGPLALAASYINTSRPNTALWDGTAGAAPISPNNSPIFSGYTSARTQQVASVAGNYTFGNAKLGLVYSNSRFEDLGSGALFDLGRLGLPREPMVAERIAAGAALVTFSGDKLLGGPQAGVAVGRRELVNKLRANALRRALRCDKLTLAALEATLRLYLRAGDLAAALPTLRYLSRSTGELELVAERACEILAERLVGDFRLEVVPSSSQIGSGAQPAEEIPSRAVRVTHPELTPERIAAIFRAARPPVIGRIADDAFLLDVRAVDDASAFAVSFPTTRP